MNNLLLILQSHGIATRYTQEGGWEMLSVWTEKGVLCEEWVPVPDRVSTIYTFLGY